MFIFISLISEAVSPAAYVIKKNMIAGGSVENDLKSDSATGTQCSKLVTKL